ncbi:hypothetical protein [Verrucomicrobium sp. 3C]|uniref:hypothetical protein n=1 Tax=Verrucomicrobium sp. 3C TaxID=1134055 RepID=UPI0012DC8AB5|nr:hypothetical protein [Verrucomicrobium sp. 3C]
MSTKREMAGVVAEGSGPEGHSSPDANGMGAGPRRARTQEGKRPFGDDKSALGLILACPTG